MPLPPIVDRELRVAARRPLTFRLRFLAAVAACLLAGLHLLAAAALPGRTPSQGRSLFELLVHLEFVCALLAGPLLTADCLSRERRDGTLGFLFLTDLGGFDVVAGKFAALGLVPIHGLLAVFPISALALFMGGVTATEFWLTTFTVLNTTFLSLAVGLLFSSLVADERQAIGLTFGGLLVLTAFPEALAWGLRSFPATAGAAGVLRLASPTGLLSLSFASPTGAAPPGFGASLAYQHLLAWLTLMAASGVVRSSWRTGPMTRARGGRQSADSPSPAPGTGPRAEKASRLSRLAAGRQRRLRLSGPIAVLAWQSSWTRVAVPWVTLLSLAAAVVLFGVGVRRHSAMVAANQGVLAITLGFYALKLLLVVHVVYFLQDLCRSGTMELILTTPIPSHVLRQGHLAALRAMFAWPIAVLGLSHITLNLAGRLLAGGDWPSQTYLVLASIAPPLLITGVHCLDFLAATFHATTWALRYDRPVKAVLRSVLLALALPLLFCSHGRFLIDLLIIGQHSGGLDQFRNLALGWYFRDGPSRTFGAPRQG